MSGARFGYWRDPVCIMACVAYALNRWWLAPGSPPGSFLRNHFDDVLLIPAALPFVLWLQRRLGLRLHDGWPSIGEVLGHLCIWALIAEVLGPALMHRGTSDWRDAIAYTAGALLAMLCWRAAQGRGPHPV